MERTLSDLLQLITTPVVAEQTEETARAALEAKLRSCMESVQAGAMDRVLAQLAGETPAVPGS